MRGCSSSSTPRRTSIRRSSRTPGSSSRSGSRGTSTAAPGDALASSSRTSSSVALPEQRDTECAVIDAPTQQRVKALLRDFMDAWIAKQYDELRRIEAEGFSPSGVLAPFHDALVPGIRGLGERGFSTALGNFHERIALVIGENAHAEARRAFDLTGSLPVLAREFITQRINQLSRGEAPPDHLNEREQLLRAFGDEVPATTRVDLHIKTDGGEDHYFEMKSAKPNRGQCIEMKQRQLTALGIRRDEQVFAWWGVPYDPYGDRKSTHLNSSHRYI